MRDRRWSAAAVLLLVSLTGRLSAQEPTPWHDPSPHKIQFVTVDKDVKLEVLDWGGTGRPIVLLAGLGNTAHVFDDFAPKLTSEYHVYGVTRRGFGASSVPAAGYSADRLGDDVIAVLDALKLDRPVLVGHSIAGQELSSVGSRHPERVAGLVYLDAGYSYAYYDRSLGDFALDRQELLAQLEKLQPGMGLPDLQVVQQLLQEDLPVFEKDLKDVREHLQTTPVLPPTPPPPVAADQASFSSLVAYRARVFGITYPEAEFREIFQSRQDGGVGERRTPSSVNSAISAGEEKYSNIRVPILSIYALPHGLPPALANDPDAHAFNDRADKEMVEPQARAFETGVPSARVVRMPQADHYVFISNEADVLREMRAFIEHLP